MLANIFPKILCLKPPCVYKFPPSRSEITDFAQFSGVIIAGSFIILIIGVITPKGITVITSILSPFYFLKKSLYTLSILFDAGYEDSNGQINRPVLEEKLIMALRSFLFLIIGTIVLLSNTTDVQLVYKIFKIVEGLFFMSYPAPAIPALLIKIPMSIF